MPYSTNRLRAEDGSWAALLADWQGQCDQLGEDFEQYEDSPIAVVRELAEGPIRDDAAVYSIRDEQKSCALFQANVAFLPGYVGKVLRVRMMYLSPLYDYGELSIDEYAQVVVALFESAVNLSYSAMPAPHVKFHLRSPTDRQYFAAIGTAINGRDIFDSVAVRGAWLYITKKQ